MHVCTGICGSFGGSTSNGQVSFSDICRLVFNLWAKSRIFDSVLVDQNQISKMSERTEREKHADTIIRNHIIWSMGAGLIPVPIVDFFAVSGIQLDMIRQLCKVYEQDFKESEGKASITSLTGSGIGRMGSKGMITLIH